MRFDNKSFRQAMECLSIRYHAYFYVFCFKLIVFSLEQTRFSFSARSQQNCFKTLASTNDAVIRSDRLLPRLAPALIEAEERQYSSDSRSVKYVPPHGYKAPKFGEKRKYSPFHFPGQVGSNFVQDSSYSVRDPDTRQEQG